MLRSRMTSYSEPNRRQRGAHLQKGLGGLSYFSLSMVKNTLQSTAVVRPDTLFGSGRSDCDSNAINGDPSSCALALTVFSRGRRCRSLATDTEEAPVFARSRHSLPETAASPGTLIVRDPGPHRHQRSKTIKYVVGAAPPLCSFVVRAPSAPPDSILPLGVCGRCYADNRSRRRGELPKLPYCYHPSPPPRR